MDGKFIIWHQQHDGPRLTIVVWGMSSWHTVAHRGIYEHREPWCAQIVDMLCPQFLSHLIVIVQYNSAACHKAKPFSKWFNCALQHPPQSPDVKLEEAVELEIYSFNVLLTKWEMIWRSYSVSRVVNIAQTLKVVFPTSNASQTY